ncbi:MAG: hypothetical protein ACE5G3_10870 [Gammaproteobacteria bacterium]
MMLLDSLSAADDGASTQPAPAIPAATDKLGEHETAMPEMSSSDTSATGMLRLEDLDARFAETIFAEDSNKAASTAGAASPAASEKLAS